MPPRGGGNDDCARTEAEQAELFDMSALDELMASEWPELMASALDDLAWLTGARR